MRDNKNIAKEVIDYWYIIEFLSQRKFPVQKKEKRDKVESIKTLCLNKDYENQEVLKTKQLTIYMPLDGKSEIQDSVDIDNSIYKLHQESSSIGHICYGHIPREDIVRKLYDLLDIKDDRNEMESDDICLFAFKRDTFGLYHPDSLELSPLIWGLYKCYFNKTKKEKGITIQNYYEDMRLLRQKIDLEMMVNNDFIDSVLKIIVKVYIEPLKLEKVLKRKGIFVYTRFKNLDIKNEKENRLENLSRLISNFYASDLSMILSDLDDEINYSEMQKEVIQYIVSPFLTNKSSYIHKDKRIDIRQNKEVLKSILSAENISLGKWPSRFNPAFMQQVAINYGAFDLLDKSIFSVNGPPGTGKTTLLKEIIAHNIVARAEKLATFEVPDDAFVKESFVDEFENKKIYHGYFPKYCKFKDPSINNHSMLVASNNNAAVENITAELPSSSRVLKDLRASKSDDSKNTKKLEFIQNLFDISKSDEREIYYEYRKEIIEGTTPPKIKKKFCAESKEDIYFSWLAHKMLNNGENLTPAKEIDTWGLVSAPLGKKSNVDTYYYNVLSHFINSAMRYTSSCEDRLKKYKIARNEFLKQLERVNSLKDQLILESKVNEETEVIIANIQKQIRCLDEKEKTIKSSIECLVSRHNNIARNYSLTKSKFSKMQDEKQIVTRKVEKINKEINKNKSLFLNIVSVIKELEDNVGLLNKLISKLYKSEGIIEIERKKKERSRLEEFIVKLNNDLETSKKALRTIEKVAENLSNQLKDVEETLVAINAKIDTHNNDLLKNQQLMIQYNKDIEEETKSLTIQFEMLKQTRVILDELFWDKFDAKDALLSTEAQIANPWTTDEFNREREILFFKALKLQKEFILSSKSCRINFNLLSMMWGYTGDEEKNNIIFSKIHREQAMPHLFSTLFLLTPVISTTFASVSSFFVDVKNRDSIGLLIIDEAGQAPPQIALGALWRSKRAIVVGDPKQVEPVVTSDTKIIMKAFNNQVCSSYQDVSASVQSFSDAINPIGGHLYNDKENGELGNWVGCPLVVHRRCIEPMFQISNELSYGHSMKYQTNAPDQKTSESFIREDSCWHHVKGNEIGNKNHYVKMQGQLLLDYIKKVFSDSTTENSPKKLPSIYIISPFTTVIEGLKKILKADKMLSQIESFQEWLEMSLGTVHKFQGKEANEVFFVLGCDENSIKAMKWVNSNIANVAVTRAKYRLYVIGDYDLWGKSEVFKVLIKYLPKVVS